MREYIRKYRVVKYDGKFIAQHRRLLLGWEGIDRDENDTWLNADNQIKYCAYDSFEEAHIRLCHYKSKNENEIKFEPVEYL